MIDSNTDFFSIVNNFSKHKDIESKIIFGKSQTAKITIAIPTYKRPSLLKETLESAINQSYNKDYVIIVVDNNPERNDETEMMMKQYHNKTNIIYYKNNKNLGMTGNWNRMIQLANSEWIVMLHDDDLLSTDFLIELLPYLKNNVDLISCKQIIFKSKIPCSCLNKKGKAYHFPIQHYWKGNTFSIAGIVMRKSSVIDLGGFNDAYYPTQDSCFWALMTYYKNTITIDKELSYYRIEDNASLKNEVLDKFIYNEFFLTNAIMKKELPSFIVNILQIYKTHQFKKAIQNTFKKNYENDFYQYTNYFLLLISKIANKLYNKYINIRYPRNEFI